MKCPYCNSVLSLKNNRCDRCGEDVRMYKRVVKASNACYNQGLMKAKVRDLSGAVDALKKALELDKNNTNARNLLGLVYYEMGETVNALREWVLSKHLQENDNDADEYISMVQSNPTKLENTNQAIKKYNQALASAKQGSPDLAIIQLKKVVSLNPKFIRAYQLLALLYMQAGEKDKAGKQLVKANAIDVNNTTTLRYMKELGINGTKVVREVTTVKEDRKALNDGKNGEFNAFAGMNNFKEDKPSIWPYLNLVIGVVVGIIVFYVLIGPTVSSSKISELNTKNAEFQRKNSDLQNEVDRVTKERDDYKAQIEELTGKVEEDTNATADPNATQDPNATPTGDTAINLLLQSAGYVLNDDLTKAATAMTTLKEDSFTVDSAKELYKTIKEKSLSSYAEKLYSQGYTKYERGKFDEAIELLQAANAIKDDYEDANYILARCYMKQGKNDKAREIFQDLVDKHPTTRRGKEAKTQLRQLPEASASPSASPTATPSETE